MLVIARSCTRSVWIARSTFQIRVGGKTLRQLPRQYVTCTSPYLRKAAASPSRPPLPPVSTLFATEELPPARAEKLFRARLRGFARNEMQKRKAASVGVSGKLYEKIAANFAAAALDGHLDYCNPKDLAAAYNSGEGIISVDRYLLSAFYQFAEPHLPADVVDNFRSLRQLSDLRYPSEWFPEARQMQRQIILHVGPTNSGKTYRALKRLSEAESGIYCGPLRLLAHEVFEKMNAKGVACNLLTGEERREVSPNATLTSSTVEMANLAKPMEVAVIDEIQLIADPIRGWAWTQALLGLKAKEIHLCGEPSVVPLIKSICESLNEEVIVNEYERLTPVEVMKDALQGDWKRIQKGDCVVAFSRQNIFAIKDKIEKETGLQCAVVYGALPPETRALQAKAFNDPDSGLDVMVASDAIGMGLNLNIKRIIFSTIHKFDGSGERIVSIPQMKQIGGRAGRFGTMYAQGQVTTMYSKDLPFVRSAMNAPITYLTEAGLMPTVDIIEMFALQMPDEKFSSLLEKFEELASLDGTYFLCNFKDHKFVADLIESIPLSIRDRYTFVTAPCPTRNVECTNAFKFMVKCFSEKETCELDDLVSMPNKAPATMDGLNRLESSHKIILLYMWLSLRFPETFTTSQERGLELKSTCEELIDQALKEYGADMERRHRKRMKRQRQSIAKKRKN